jgi:hypothetical protein
LKRKGIYWAVTVMVAACIALAAFVMRPSREPSRSVSQESEGRKVVARQEKLKQDFVRILRANVYTERSRQLLAFMEEHSAMAIHYGHNDIRLTDAARKSVNDPFFFAIVFMPEYEAQSLRGKLAVWSKDNLLRIAAHYTSEGWLSVVAYHELEHAWRHKHGLDKEYENSDTIGGAEEEVAANATGCDIIAAWRPDEYRSFLSIKLSAIDLHSTGGLDQLMGEPTTAIFPELRSLGTLEAALTRGALLACKVLDEARHRGMGLAVAYHRYVSSLNKKYR